MQEPRWNTGVNDFGLMDTFNCFSTLSRGAARIIRICFSMDGNAWGPPTGDDPRKSVTREGEPITPFSNIWETFQQSDQRLVLAEKNTTSQAHRSRLRTGAKAKVGARVKVNVGKPGQMMALVPPNPS
jgi:hypothetical protein